MKKKTKMICYIVGVILLVISFVGYSLSNHILFSILFVIGILLLIIPSCIKDDETKQNKNQKEQTMVKNQKNEHQYIDFSISNDYNINPYKDENEDEDDELSIEEIDLYDMLDEMDGED